MNRRQQFRWLEPDDAGAPDRVSVVVYRCDSLEGAVAFKNLLVKTG